MIKNQDIQAHAIPIQQSRTVLTDLVFPNDTNHHHTIFGGKVMAYVDKIACISAMRHCRQPVVTASSDSFDFLAPIKTGEAINWEAYVVCTHRTSMDVIVKVERENLLTGERQLTANARLTMLAIGEDGKPTLVPEALIRKKKNNNIKKRMNDTDFVIIKTKQVQASFLA